MQAFRDDLVDIGSMVVSAKYVSGYVRRPHRIANDRIDDVLHTRFHVYADRRRGDWFARGERLQCYAMRQAGCAEPTSVHLWIEDEFLVDERSSDGEPALLAMIAANVAYHEGSDDRDVDVLIPAKLERQYLLDRTDGAGDPLRLRIELYRDLATGELFATAERRAWYEIRRFDCGRLEHVAFWARDEAVCTVIENIACTDCGFHSGSAGTDRPQLAARWRSLQQTRSPLSVGPVRDREGRHGR